MTVDMRELAFGVEIEFTGMTRRRAAEICAAYFGTTVGQDAAGRSYRVRDETGRSWKFVDDSSIRAEPSGDEYRVELVTPICQYGDIERIQELLRKLREKAGSKSTDPAVFIFMWTVPALMQDAYEIWSIWSPIKKI